MAIFVLIGGSIIKTNKLFDHLPQQLLFFRFIFTMSESNTDLCAEPTFSKVFRDYAQTLNSYLFYQTGNESLAQDLVQEAFTRLWKNCSSVALSTAQGYVFTIAKNLLKNNYQHQKVVLRYEQGSPPSSTVHDPQFLLEEKELADRLQSAIAALPEKQRVVFLLSRIDKKTYQEIADMLEISRQAVEKRIYKALDTLRKVARNLK